MKVLLRFFLNSYISCSILIIFSAPFLVSLVLLLVLVLLLALVPFLFTLFLILVMLGFLLSA